MSVFELWSPSATTSQCSSRSRGSTSARFGRNQKYANAGDSEHGERVLAMAGSRKSERPWQGAEAQAGDPLQVSITAPFVFRNSDFWSRAFGCAPRALVRIAFA